MNASNARASSIPATTSTLRPRTGRLVSGLSEGDETSSVPSNAAAARIAPPLPSPFETRPVSPIPSARLSRPKSGHGSRTTSIKDPSGRANNLRQRKADTQSAKSMAGLWGGSWSTLQGIASDLLAGDAASNAKDKRTHVRRSSVAIKGNESNTNAPPSHWGLAVPTSHSATGSIGAGTKEEQVAAFRSQKRRDLLTVQETSYVDALGKFKRRLSDDRASMSAPPVENEDRDALVYVHHVKKDDTLAGITIKFNCSANTLRKANRMWPNDTVQSRPTIILPVDACGVKGKLVQGPAEIDLLGSETEALSAGQAEEVPALPEPLTDGEARNTRIRTNSASTTASRRRSSSVAASSMDTEPPWHHDSWVLLPGTTEPVEIARLSRRALGYFPPARRKSNCYSDLDTPSTSLDLSRAPGIDSAFNPSLSPIRQNPPQRPQRPRRLSNATTGYFPSYLAGPGGVGTMGKDVRFPGPGPDGLNKMFAKHLPDVAPPRNQQNLLTPEFPLYTDEPTPVGSGASTPSHGKSLNLENVGGAIESWMRRMASTTKHAMAPPERQRAARASLGTPGMGAGGVGDLIEMTDEFEIGGDEEGEEEELGRQGSAVFLGQSSSSATAYLDGSVRSRGRSDGAGSKAGKSGKED